MDSKKVLIVEDHGDCRALLNVVLSRSGYTVVEAGTGPEAIERAGAMSFDLIVMDFGLPGMSGDKVIMRLKADPFTKRVPVIVTTGYLDAQVAKRAMVAGAAFVLLKPYDLEELTEVMARCLSSECDRELRPVEPATGRELNVE